MTDHPTRTRGELEQVVGDAVSKARLSAAENGPSLALVAGAMRWSQLVALMALGEGPELTLSGVVACRWYEPVGFAAFPATGGVEDVGELGAMSVYEASYRVVKDGDRIRRERLDGSVSSIEHGRQFWTVAPDDDTAVHHPAAHMTFPDHQLTRRRPLQWWSGADYTLPAGPIRPVVFLGRPAWSVEVAPPPHKPYGVTWIVDDETGHILSAASAAAGFVRWDQLEVGRDVDPGMFTWTGPTRPFTTGERRPAPG